MFKYSSIKKYGNKLLPALEKKFGNKTYFSASEVRSTVYKKNFNPAFLPLGYIISLHPDELAKDNLVIDCRGIRAKAEFEGLRGVKGEMLILRCPEVQLTRPVRLLHPRIPLYIVPRGDGVYMLGATMVESSAKQHASVRSVMELLNAAYALNPAFGEAEILEIGVDSRPAFSDNLPRIHHQGQIIRANGLYRHGFLLAPTLAKMMADYLDQGVESEWFEINAFDTKEKA